MQKNNLKARVEELRARAELERIRVEVEASKQLRRRIRTGEIEIEHKQSKRGVTE